MSQKYIVVFATFPNKRTAKKIINGLVNTKMAACGNVFELFSIYRWQEKVEETTEYGVFIKTKKSKYRAVEKYLKENHPYEVPEIIAWDIEKGQRAYLNWINKVTD
jgi:periplasmic divalent cation tolerance protein